VPAKPRWYSRIEYVISELRSLPRPFVDRATVEFLFGIGRRRAQQIMAPCITDRVGTNGLADRELLIARLRQLADGDEGHYERERRKRVAATLVRFQRERRERPQVLVEAPLAITAQQLKDLPDGVRLEPGHISVEFDDPHQALEKLLALAMAIGNDFDGFEHQTRPKSTQ